MSAFEAFVTVHQYQLSAIPKDLWLPLFMKLGEDYLDAGNYVELHYGDPLPGYSLHVKEGQTLKKHGEIFLIDHAWTTTLETAKKELKETPGLLDRLENMMDIGKEEYQSEDESETEEGHQDDKDDVVNMVAEQANVSYEEAKGALEAEKYEVVNAIMRLTLDEDFKKESDRLQEQVMGQLIASGKAREKEEKVNKEKEERKKKRKEMWMDNRVQNVYDKMWSYLQTYSFSVLQQDGQPKTQTAWYINDEVGSALCHSSDPNVICVPFIFSRGASGMIPYSVLFPIKDIGPGEILTCDLVPKSIQRTIDKDAYLLAYTDRILPGQEIDDDKQARLKVTHEEWQNELERRSRTFSPCAEPVKEADKSLFVSGAEKDTIRVYTSTEFVRRFLTLPNVKLTDSFESADIIWSSQDFSDWDKLKKGHLVNQFKNENCMTFKQRLADLIQKTYGCPAWFPTTYNATTQLAEFVGDYLKGNESSNYWISKPWNFARGLEISVFKSLPALIRQHDSPTPKILQRYLARPCLYNHKKFDLRYIVLVRRIKPTLVALIYNMFWIRLANKRFSLENLDDYECQFTVMNYTNYQMTQLDHKSFIRNMEKQHSIVWSNVQTEINRSIKEVLLAAANENQPLGLNDSEEADYDAFSIYGFDVMLTDDYKPVILEVNFSPDCTRACEYDFQFVNNIFSVVDSRIGNLDKGLEAFTIL